MQWLKESKDFETVRNLVFYTDPFRFLETVVVNFIGRVQSNSQKQAKDRRQAVTHALSNKFNEIREIVNGSAFCFAMRLKCEGLSPTLINHGGH